MIIDAHVHIGSTQYVQMDADAGMLLDIADRMGIDRLFVSHLTALFYEMREGNDLLGADLARYGDRIIGYATIPTHRLGVQACDEIRRCVERYGVRGIKIYSNPDCSVTEASSTVIFETAAELDLIVLGHFTQNECDTLMQRVPEAKVIMAHMGGTPYAQGNWHLAVEVAARHENLYVDTASSMIDNGMLEYAVEHLGPEKILYGSDMPALDPWVQRAKVEGAEISAEAKQLIMGGNVQRILGL